MRRGSAARWRLLIAGVWTCSRTWQAGRRLTGGWLRVRSPGRERLGRGRRSGGRPARPWPLNASRARSPAGAAAGAVERPAAPCGPVCGPVAGLRPSCQVPRPSVSCLVRGFGHRARGGFRLYTLAGFPFGKPARRPKPPRGVRTAVGRPTSSKTRCSALPVTAVRSEARSRRVTAPSSQGRRVATRLRCQWSVAAHSRPQSPSVAVRVRRDRRHRWRTADRRMTWSVTHGRGCPSEAGSWASGPIPSTPMSPPGITRGHLASLPQVRRMRTCKGVWGVCRPSSEPRTPHFGPTRSDGAGHPTRRPNLIRTPRRRLTATARASPTTNRQSDSPAAGRTHRRHHRSRRTTGHARPGRPGSDDADHRGARRARSPTPRSTVARPRGGSGDAGGAGGEPSSPSSRLSPDFSPSRRSRPSSKGHRFDAASETPSEQSGGRPQDLGPHVLHVRSGQWPHVARPRRHTNHSEEARRGPDVRTRWPRRTGDRLATHTSLEAVASLRSGLGDSDRRADDSRSERRIGDAGLAGCPCAMCGLLDLASPGRRLGSIQRSGVRSAVSRRRCTWARRGCPVVAHT